MKFCVNIMNDVFFEPKIFSSDISNTKEPKEALANKMLAAGNHQLHIDGTSWSTGLYILQLQVGTKVYSRKVTLMK